MWEVIVSLGTSAIRSLQRLTAFLMMYPIQVDEIGQFETTRGYVFVVQVRAKANKVVSIPKASISVKVEFNLQTVTEQAKGKLVYGESVQVFDSQIILNAYIENRSFVPVAHLSGGFPENPD